jgi:proline dehydrogenase
MLRSLFIYLSKASWAATIVGKMGLAWRMASRFVAGESMEDAIRVVKELNGKGINATLDHLGEHTTTTDEATRAAEQILSLLAAIQESGARANVSLKLTQLGMGLDDELCRRNLALILRRAQSYGNFVRIDMEDSPYTDKTLAILADMRAAGFGPETVGTVLQSYLYRTADDLEKLLHDGTRIRLVKGAYNEPARAAFPKKADVDSNFDKLSSQLIHASVELTGANSDGRRPPIAALGTHDERRITFGKNCAEEAGLPKSALEIQMLFGIRRDLQESLTEQGYPVRVYVPYGHRWYPYFMRRLAERPANLWFFVSNLLRR